MTPGRDKSIITIRVWTETFLGTPGAALRFLDLLNTLEHGAFAPDRWSAAEPVRNPYSPSVREQIVQEWTRERPPGSGQAYNYMFFRRRKPRVDVMLGIYRQPLPDLNKASVEIPATGFAGADGADRIHRIVKALEEWSRAALVEVWHSEQLHSPMPMLTPLKRLARMNWLTFFGWPYVDLFGLERLRTAPCHRIVEDERGVYVFAAERPDRPELTASTEVLRQLERHLGQDAFAGPGFPDVPCRVPQFDLSEITAEEQPAVPKSPKRRRRQKSGSLGFELSCPPGWRIVSEDEVTANRDVVRWSDPHIEEFFKARASKPIVVFMKYPHTHPGVNPTVQVMLRPMGPAADLPLVDLAAAGVAVLQRSFDDFSLTRPVDLVQVAGQTAAHFRATYTLRTTNGGEAEVMARMWLVLRGSYVFTVGMSGPSTGPDVCEKEFQAVLDSMSIL